MLEEIFGSVLDAGTAAELTAGGFVLCTAASLALGLATAFLYMHRNTYSKAFVVTLALLPAITQMVILLVNGSLGTGIAVMGAFNLVRFRSIPGSAKEIGSIFLAMALGLATGMGYIGVAVIFLVVYAAASLTLNLTRFGEQRLEEKELRITIPESLDYTGLFGDIFEKYTAKTELIRVKTSNMGSLYQLSYRVRMKAAVSEKEFIDDIRCRNGNLDIILGRVAFEKNEL